MTTTQHSYDFMTEVYETAHTLTNNTGEAAIVRHDEFIIELIKVLIQWGQRYECKMDLDRDFDAYWQIKVI